MMTSLYCFFLIFRICKNMEKTMVCWVIFYSRIAKTFNMLHIQLRILNGPNILPNYRTRQIFFSFCGQQELIPALLFPCLSSITACNTRIVTMNYLAICHLMQMPIPTWCFACPLPIRLRKMKRL